LPNVSAKFWITRRSFVLLHRYVGLGLALFLILEGLTGSLLAFNTELERLINPQLFAKAEPGAPRLSLAELCERAEALVPKARVAYMFVSPDQAMMRMWPRKDPATGKGFDLDLTQLFLDPTTGAELGRRYKGDLTQGRVNIMPFIYRLHQELALNQTGVTVLGFVALIWTIDCLIAFYLTLPVTRRAFWRRWKPSWLIKWPASTFRLNFDLHRAGGLWLWPMLFIFAWSSVMFEYRSVYDWVTRHLFDYASPGQEMISLHPNPGTAPKLSWREAERVGAKLMAEQASALGLKLEGAEGIAYIEPLGVYTYSVRSDRDVRGRTPETGIWFDGDSGELRNMSLPTGAHTGNTIGSWLWALHFADIHDFLAYRLFVCFLGLAVGGLSGTGIYIWLKKRRAGKNRLRALALSAAAPVSRLSQDSVLQ
jgi:uncharacterized iron-regulated membrane protein